MAADRLNQTDSSSLTASSALSLMSRTETRHSTPGRVMLDPAMAKSSPAVVWPLAGSRELASLTHNRFQMRLFWAKAAPVKWTEASGSLRHDPQCPGILPRGLE